MLLLYVIHNSTDTLSLNFFLSICKQICQLKINTVIQPSDFTTNIGVCIIELITYLTKQVGNRGGGGGEIIEHSPQKTELNCGVLQVNMNIDIKVI